METRLFRTLYFLTIFFVSFAYAEVSSYVSAAKKLPVAFAVVREDSEQDFKIIKQYFPEDKVSMLMVASGGCTAAYLASKGVIKDLTIVDPNPAQLALTQIKMQMLSLPIERRLELLGYSKLSAADRKVIIQGFLKALSLPENILGNIDEIAQEGLDFIGRYEKVFENLREALASYHAEIEELFACKNLEEQRECIQSSLLFKNALDEALDKIMSQENLVALFGEKATANRVQEFSRHFAAQIRLYLAHHLASRSPWMAHLLLGTFYDDLYFPWLEVTPQAPFPELTYINDFMDAALKKSENEEYDVIHLSNILDWLSPEEGAKTLSLAYKALKPGGVVVIRQLNSNLDIPSLEKQFSWDKETSQEFLHNDRSFFYRNFFIGIKPSVSAAPSVKELADSVLQETPLIEGAFFKNLSRMDKKIFQSTQKNFCFAVDYFSRPMAALIARFNEHAERVDILHNIVEEHGDFDSEQYHSTTFRKFLKSIGVDPLMLEEKKAASAVHMFNYTLMGVCTNQDPLIALSALGIIEYAFADISAFIAKSVVSRGWVEPQNLVHYNLHAYLDKKHAEDFFKIAEPFVGGAEEKAKIIQGLRLGAYIFNRLYEDIYTEALRGE